jgi:hypothetical protein
MVTPEVVGLVGIVRLRPTLIQRIPSTTVMLGAARDRRFSIPDRCGHSVDHGGLVLAAVLLRLTDLGDTS